MSVVKSMVVAAGVAVLPISVSAQDWSGAFAGGSLSVGAAETEIFDSDENATYGYSRVDGLTGMAALRGGYNFQSGKLVFGPEISVGLSSFDESYEFDFCSPTTISAEISSFAALRGRIGFAIDDVLIYGAVGVAQLEGDRSAQCDTRFTDSIDSSTALIAGIGAEYRIADNLAATFEYTAIRGDDEEVVAERDVDDIFTFSSDADLFSVGVNYYFN